MSDDSPLFVSALELLAHATEIYAQKNPRKYKFVVLHLANAIELILKDYVMDLGLSIYKNPKETIGIWDCFKNLSDNSIDIPERPLIELVVDDRNAIQHRFGSPDERTVSYYLFRVVAFFQRFLQSHYNNLELSDSLQPHLPIELLELLGLAKGESGEPNENNQLDELLAVSPDSAILLAFRTVESHLSEMFESSLDEARDSPYFSWTNINASRLKEFFDALERIGMLESSAFHKFVDLRNLRNQVAHAVIEDFTPEFKEKIKENIDFSKYLINVLEESKSKYKYSADTGEMIPINCGNEQ